MAKQDNLDILINCVDGQIDCPNSQSDSWIDNWNSMDIQIPKQTI